MRSTLILIVLLAISAGLVACAPDTLPEDTATPTLGFVTVTLRPSETLRPSATPTLPSATPTFPPMDGVTTTKINVRSGPGTQYGVVEILAEGVNVQIVGKDFSGAWLAVINSGTPNGRGWIIAGYVRTGNINSLPIITVIEINGTPAITGRVNEKLNVRSGPGLSFDVLGVLNPQDIVVVLGKTEGGAWLLIQFTGGPNEQGWVTAGYLQVSDAGALLVVAASGATLTPVFGPGTPSPVPATPTPTVGPAAQDGDSQTAPAISVIFSPSTARQFSYSSDLSAPEGDLEDWIAFTPYASLPGAARVYFSLDCSGRSVLPVELWQGGALLSAWGSLVCGEKDKPFDLIASRAYLLCLSAAEQTGRLAYVHYTLTIRNAP